MRQIIRGSYTEQKCRTATVKVLKEIEARFVEIELLWGDVDETTVDLAAGQRLNTEKLRSDLAEFWDEQDQERKAGAA